MSIDKLPGAFWIALVGGIGVVAEVFVSAQWPESQPAWVLAGMAALGVLVGLVKVLWPEPKAPAVSDANLPPGVSAQAGLSAPVAAQKKESKLTKFLF